MGRNKQKKHTFSQQHNNNQRKENDWKIKPLKEHEKSSVVDDDDHHHDVDNIEQPQITSSSSSNTKPSHGIKFKWVSRNSGTQVENSGTHVEKSGLGPKTEVGQSSSGGAEVEERESEEEVSMSVSSEIFKGCELREKDDDDDDNNVDDFVKRLENLQLAIKEVELSDEQIRINDQAQEDELLAMESIYGNNVHIFERQQGLRSFQIHVHFELPSSYPVSAKIKADTHANSKLDNSDGFLYSFKVQYLSPIILTCLLPRSYPSDSPPSFTVSVQWLHKSNISKLCSMLDSLWNEQPGQEILYQWVDWLHSSSLPYLGFDEELVLGPYDVKGVSDRRALSGSFSADIDIPSMKSYDKERQHENFLCSAHQCCICFSEYPGTEFLRLPCHHFYCEKCMKTYADVHVKEGTVNKLQCPNTKCDGMIPPGLLKRLLGEEEFERWESLMLQKTLDSMSDVAYCPRCETACLEDEDHHAQCSKCYFSFCSLCREKRHVGIACLTPELKLKILEERQNSSHLKDEQRRRELNMIHELQSVKEVLRDSKQCPSCKVAISRTEGCNKMVCSMCGQYFCYRCNKAISGYEHFREGACELFPQAMIEQWEERVNVRQVLGQIQVQLFAENSRRCPMCRQLNAKMGNNNHIFCWACQNHFCYLCLKVVRRSNEHYGPKGCKQHSEG